MKIDENEQPDDNDWKRVFKILPVKTEDGFRVMCGYVWKFESDDPFEPIRYHTDPDGKETARIVRKSYHQKMGDNILPVGSNPPPMPKVKRPKAPPPPPKPRKVSQPLQKDVIEAVEKAIEFGNDRQLDAIRRMVAEHRYNKRKQTHGTGPR